MSSPPWRTTHARRYSRDATAPHHQALWVWVANSWRLRGYDDERCIREACMAVTGTIAIKIENAAYAGKVAGNKKSGPRAIRSDRIPSKFQARHILREISAAARKKPPRPPGE